MQPKTHARVHFCRSLQNKAAEFRRILQRSKISLSDAFRLFIAVLTAAHIYDKII